MRLSTSSALVVFVASAVASVHAHEDHDHDMQMPLDYVKFPYQAAYYPGDNDGKYIVFISPRLTYATAFVVTADSIFSGITTFAKLPWVQCLGKDRTVPFDIAFIGAPFVRQSYLSREHRLIVHDSRTPGLPTVLAPDSDQRASGQGLVG